MPGASGTTDGDTVRNGGALSEPAAVTQVVQSGSGGSGSVGDGKAEKFDISRMSTDNKYGRSFRIWERSKRADAGKIYRRSTDVEGRPQ